MEKNNLIVVIGDIHGCINTLKSLFVKIDKLKIPVYSVGDVVDRGTKSKEVIQFCIENDIKPVIGNHDFWMLEAIENPENKEIVERWILFYGNTTLDSYIDINKQTSDEFNNIFLKFVKITKRLKHYDFIKSLPYKIEIGNVIITHSGIAEFAEEGEDYILNYEPVIKFKNKLQIFGHNHRREVDYKQGWYANIDTGCGHGIKLTAAIVDSEKAIITDMIEEKFKD